MKGIDLLCSSPASTAISVTTKTDHPHHYSSMARHGYGGRKLDRHNPHLRDNRRAKPTTTTNTTTSSSASPLQFQPHNSAKPNKKQHKNNKNHKTWKSNKTSSGSTKSSSKQQKDMLISDTSPSRSSRYLLSDSVFLDVVTDFEPVSTFVHTEESTSSSAVGSGIDNLGSYDDFPAMVDPCSCSASSSSSSTIASTSRSSSPDQVVVLRVSLHCKGCEGKVRKHISRMKGVKSFNIDFQAKKVTVIGDVTPVGVLASISRVKRAQFWHSPSPLSLTTKF
ncbi:hypothetical protein Sjap_001702 [Stephania japonica]|uniref:HMA domain-containing protein n=1 Tax=Stephania japonica TaxID=461633 RepID=A0AAP0PRY3_9MAGN